MIKEDIKYCCETFSWLISEIGKKGLSALPINDAERRVYFVLQGRSSDLDDQDATQESTAQLAIHFCPWCGTEMNSLISRNKNHIIALARLHKDKAL